MSEAEMQIEEESLQLTPEDIQLLSEYSWDMTEYTSRFGYFFLGSEKENVQGLTKWQAENIYQLTPTPPGMEDALQNMKNLNMSRIPMLRSIIVISMIVCCIKKLFAMMAQKIIIWRSSSLHF